MSAAPPSVSPTSTKMHPVVTVERWDTRKGRAFGARYQNLILLLTTSIFAASVPALWLFGYTFWVLLEATSRAFAIPRGSSALAWVVSLIPRSGLLVGTYGWPLDAAFVLGLLLMWSLLYLAFDHVSLIGNRSAQRFLQAKAQADGINLEEVTHFFVDLRPLKRKSRAVGDTGYLLLLPDSLLFLGDLEKVTLPRQSITGAPQIRTQWSGLGPTWVTLLLDETWHGLRFAGRDTANRISGMQSDSEQLHAALVTWLQA